MSDTIVDLSFHGARTPSVTVVVDNYNQAPFVATAIRSVAGQTYRNFKCIVVDDASTDDSATRIRSCLNDLGDARFRLVEHARNGGQMAAMLTGVDADDAPFVAFLDGDDLWHPEFLECHLKAHLSPAGLAAMSCSDMVLIDGNDVMWAGSFPRFRRSDPRRAPPPGGDRRRNDRGMPERQDPIFVAVGEGEDVLLFVSPGYHGWLWSATSGMMFRRSLIETMRPRNTGEIRICADAYWANVAHMLGGTVLLRRVLGNYRVYGSNSWASARCFGDRSQLGVNDPAVSRRIRGAIARSMCEGLKTLSDILPPRYMMRTLTRFLGTREAREMCDHDPEIGRVLGPYLPDPGTRTGRRGFFFRLLGPWKRRKRGRRKGRRVES